MKTMDRRRTGRRANQIPLSAAVFYIVILLYYIMQAYLRHSVLPHGERKRGPVGGDRCIRTRAML